MQSPVRFNRVRKKILEKVPGGFGTEPDQVQQVDSTGFRKIFRRRSGRLWFRARSGSRGFRRRF